MNTIAWNHADSTDDQPDRSSASMGELEDRLPATFFERLLDRALSASPESPDSEAVRRSETQILCGRWVALQRLRLHQTSWALAEQVGLDPHILLMVESGLADPSLAPERTWELLGQILCDSVYPEHWTAQLVAGALGRTTELDAALLHTVQYHLGPAAAFFDHQLF